MFFWTLGNQYWRFEKCFVWDPTFYSNLLWRAVLKRKTPKPQINGYVPLNGSNTTSFPWRKEIVAPGRHIDLCQRTNIEWSICSGCIHFPGLKVTFWHWLLIHVEVGAKWLQYSWVHVWTFPELSHYTYEEHCWVNTGVGGFHDV